MQEDEDEEDDVEPKWEELDQVAFRKSIHDLLQYGMPGDSYEDRVQELREVHSIVIDEIAASYFLSMIRLLEIHPQDTQRDAQELVRRVMGDLQSLGLAIKHPQTGEPMRLAVARTPPSQGESWLQLESFDHRTRPMRLPHTIPNLMPCAAPVSTHQQGHGPQKE